MAIEENFISETVSIDFSCVNCDKEFRVSKRATLYCSKRCREDATLIRKYRAYKKDGRINESEYQKVIIIRLGFAQGSKGYYDQDARRLPAELRNEIIERDKSLCCKCGETGSEIDHINGDSKDLENLQLLCHDCHTEKTLSMIRKLNPEDVSAEAKERLAGLWLRMDAISPERACDDSENWKVLQKQILFKQRQELKKIKEDVEGKNKQENSFEKEITIQEIDDLDELESQLQALELQKKAQIEQILTPEMQAKLDAIELDFAASVRKIKENIETSKKIIKKDVLQIGSTVKATNLQVVFNKGRVTWDSKSLDKYAELHPEIKEYRREGKPSIRFRRIDKEKKQES